MSRTSARVRTATANLRAQLLDVIAVHQQGNIAQAIAGYREVLKIEPRQFDALRLLGAALLTDGQARESAAMLGKALAVRSDLPEAWSLHGDALMRLEQHADASRSYERALSLEPNRPLIWNNLGLQFHHLKQYEAALRCFDRAISLTPQLTEAWTNRGIALDELQRYEEAIESHRRALAQRPESVTILCNLGKALNDRQLFEESVASFDRAIALDAGCVAAWTGRAAPLSALGRMKEALASCDRAIELEAKDNHETLATRGTLLTNLNRHADAAKNLDRAATLAPDNAHIQLNRGLLHLTLGHFATGWEGYEWRQKVPGLSSALPPACPEWQPGEPVSGRRLLLRCEQGLGDTIQFCRFVPELAAAGASVILVVQDSLHTLLSSLKGTTQLLRVSDPIPSADLQCRLLSVPHRRGTTLETIPRDVPYLTPPAEHLRLWRERLGLPRRLRVGLAASGNPDHGNDRNRSIPLRHFATLRGLDVEWHLLQKDVRKDDLPWLESLSLVDHREYLREFADTAALARCMDVVVSVDTSIAHLAGALGVPLLLLIPIGPDWRWMLERTDSPWYPSARILRQTSFGDWEEPIARLGQALAELSAPAGCTCAAPNRDVNITT